MSSYQNSLIPGQVYPGQEKYMGGNVKYANLNYIKKVGLTHPEVLDGLYAHFSMQMGLLSCLLHYTDSSYSHSTAMKMAANGVKSGGGRTPWEKKLKYLDGYEYQWQVDTPEGWVYTIKEAPIEDPNNPGTVGANDSEFSLVIDRRLVDKDDVLMLADGITQIIVTREPQEVSGMQNTRITCRLLPTKGLPQERIPLFKLAKGQEMERKYNIKPESSDTGSRTQFKRSEWYRGHMTTMRLQYSLSGHVKRTKIKKKPYIYNGPNGKQMQFWMTEMDEAMFRERVRIMDEQMFWGKPNINADGSFRRDAQGRVYYSGTGIYHQSNRQLRTPYQNLNDFTIIDRIGKSLYRDHVNTGNPEVKPTILVLGGIEFRTDFDKLIRNEFSLSPEVLFFDGKGQFFGGGAPKGDTKVTGIRSQFNYYETPSATFVVSNCDYFDSKYRPRNLTANGESIHSKRAMLCNITRNIGGQLPISMLSVNGANSQGEISSIANSSGQFSSPVDAIDKHEIMAQGVAVHNPNFLAEMYYSDPRNV